jgi:hypothetical protein
MAIGFSCGKAARQPSSPRGRPTADFDPVVVRHAWLRPSAVVGALHPETLGSIDLTSRVSRLAS